MVPWQPPAPCSSHTHTKGSFHLFMEEVSTIYIRNLRASPILILIFLDKINCWFIYAIRASNYSNVFFLSISMYSRPRFYTGLGYSGSSFHSPAVSLCFIIVTTWVCTSLLYTLYLRLHWISPTFPNSWFFSAIPVLAK
jgi:hypothetical protein